MRYYNHVVELRTDARCWTRRLGDGQTGCRCRPHVVGSNVEREADHRTTLMADALVDPRATVPSRPVVMNQQTEQRLVRYCDSGAIAVGSDEIDPHAPEVPSLTGPSHDPLWHHRRGNSASVLAQCSVPDRHLWLHRGHPVEPPIVSPRRGE